MTPTPPDTTHDAAHAASGTAAAESVHKLEAQRRENRDKVAALGVDPYGTRVDGIVSAAKAKARYDEGADAAFQERGKEEGFADPRQTAKVAGRAVLHRDNGKLVWIQLRDHTGDIQLAVSKRDCDALGFSLAKACDLGDILVAEGPVMKTRTGEVTVWASGVEFGAKSLAAPPEKWAGLQDAEARYRKRYVDLYATPASMAALTARSRLLAEVRRFLDSRGFLEVETPVLQPTPGGAAARPFWTRLNALDMDVSLRVAPELYLKRLLVGGMPRVYELGKNYRNEGLSRRHNPEFTVVEVYQAFADYGSMRELAESLIRRAAMVRAAEVAGEHVPAFGAGPVEPVEHLLLPFGGLRIDYGAAFERVTYAELFERALGFQMDDADKVLAEVQARGLRSKGPGGAVLDGVLLVNELFEEVAEPTIDPAKPTFVLDYPAALSPLTRPRADNPQIAERWDLFIGGMEIGPAYTELNDPDVQAAKLREQLAGEDAEEATFRTFDEDFIEALKVGMPPAGGLGLGLDRLVMLLTDRASIRDVILFPFMRPASGLGGAVGPAPGAEAASE